MRYDRSSNIVLRLDLQNSRRIKDSGLRFPHSTHLPVRHLVAANSVGEPQPEVDGRDLQYGSFRLEHEQQMNVALSHEYMCAIVS